MSAALRRTYTHRGSERRRHTSGGAPIAAEELYHFVERCASANSANYSSMLQDVAAGRRTEIDYLNGWVARRAQGCGLRCEANASLAGRVLALSAGGEGVGPLSATNR